MNIKNHPPCFEYYVNISWLAGFIPKLVEQLQKERINSVRHPFKHRRLKASIAKLPDVEKEMTSLTAIVFGELCSPDGMAEEKSRIYAKTIYTLWNKHIKTVKIALSVLGPDWLALLKETHGLVTDWDVLPFELGYQHAK